MPKAAEPIRFDCAGIRVPKYILKLPQGSKLIVKELFDESVNPDRCLVQMRYYNNALTPMTEDESQSVRVVCQGS